MFWTYLLSYKKKLPRKSAAEAGFGLVELMVSISIMTIVSALIFINQKSFNSAILMRGQAYDIALQAREIQLSAVAAMGNGSTFRSVYGLYFDKQNNDDEYVVFKDENGDNFYDANDVVILRKSLDSRFEIRSIKTVDGSTQTSIEDVSVVFARPNFDARFFGSASSQINKPAILIEISGRGNVGAGNGDVRTIEITASGQIAVLPLVVSANDDDDDDDDG